MTRDEQEKRRHEALRAVKLIVNNHNRISPPSYRRVARDLNAQQMQTTWNNEWTQRRLLRFLQRLGYSGLYGVKAELNGRSKKLE